MLRWFKSPNCIIYTHFPIKWNLVWLHESSGRRFHDCAYVLGENYPKRPNSRLCDDLISSYLRFESKFLHIPRLHLSISILVYMNKKESVFRHFVTVFTESIFNHFKPSRKTKTIVKHILHKYQDQKIICLTLCRSQSTMTQNTFFSAVSEKDLIFKPPEEDVIFMIWIQDLRGESHIDFRTQCVTMTQTRRHPYSLPYTSVPEFPQNW